VSQSDLFKRFGDIQTGCKEFVGLIVFTQAELMRIDEWGMNEHKPRGRKAAPKFDK
jgi:hypothetical protein